MANVITINDGSGMEGYMKKRGWQENLQDGTQRAA
jgi:hypothetical protein